MANRKTTGQVQGVVVASTGAAGNKRNAEYLDRYRRTAMGAGNYRYG